MFAGDDVTEAVAEAVTEAVVLRECRLTASKA
jgi:hypothetical protein